MGCDCDEPSNIPRSFDQCFKWCQTWLPNGKKFHIVGIAAVCWAIRKTRNRVCFVKMKLLNPLSIICYACALMNYWAGLFLGVDNETLQASVEDMLQIATKLLNKKQKVDDGCLIKDVPDNDGEDDL